MEYLRTRKNLIQTIQSGIRTDMEFKNIALNTFRFQAKYNETYKEYIGLVGVDPKSVVSIHDIPFLPIELFKNHEVKTGEWTAEKVFGSSGTTSLTTSHHHVRDLYFYLDNTVAGFEELYGPLQEYTVFALLPSYLERTNSSLVAMASHWITQSKQADSGFFLNDYALLVSKLKEAAKFEKKVLLLGVTFALLDLVEQYGPLKGNPRMLIMETGGMKGRRKEMIREELHRVLKKGFGVDRIHSEYGMTELQSQGYFTEDKVFQPISTMRVFSRELNDPFKIVPFGKLGALNIIDLANVDSCAFIATDDLGRVYENNTFEVLGRIDASDLRGCNLMISQQQ